MPPIRTHAEHEQQEHRDKLANSYHSLLSEFSSKDLKSVGNYTLGRLIGKGSFGKVYLAQHRLTNGSKVVLKSANKNDPNLAREIHHHRQFLHPHIARLYEVIVTENLVWLALEWCPGDELYHHLLQHGRMEPSKVQKIFTQLVGAVTYVHQKSCVHRDLKLENILLDKHENVKLVDFGFTREYHGTTSYLQTWCGTVCYSAPEMLKGEKYAGEKVDVWSLGVILYALLCGELPYDEDDDDATKAKILKEEPVYPEHLPEGARDLIKKLLSKRPLLRPALADVIKDPWLAEHAPQQQEILKIQQPAPFSTQLEKDTLQRMRSAGVNIDTVIEHVLAQRCDPLAGWWSLLIEKEQRKEKRRERKRKEREADVRSLRRLSAASSKLLALGEIQEGAIMGSPSSRGRPTTRAGGVAEPPLLPRVSENKMGSPDATKPSTPTFKGNTGLVSRSPSRPAPPPKDHQVSTIRRARNTSRSSASMLRVVTTNPDLLSPQYVPPPQRKRRALIQQPWKEQLSWVKHWFKEGAYKRNRATNSSTEPGNSIQPPKIITNGPVDRANTRDLKNTRQDSLPEPPKRISFEERLGLPRVPVPIRPRVNTTSSMDSRSSQRKRQSLSPGTLTPHSSVRRSSAGLRGRKSTSSSVSSVRSTYKPHHQHTHSKASSTSSASVASPSGLSSASGSRLGRSPHSSVKLLPSTPTGSTLPSSIRVSRRPPPAGIGPLPTFSEPRHGFTAVAPGSPGLPVFARRKRSIFKGPGISSAPTGFGRTALPGPSGGRSGSVPRRTSIEISGITEEDEEEVNQEDEMMEEDDEDVEEVDHFGPELQVAVPPDTAAGPAHHITDIDSEQYTEPITPITPLDEVFGGISAGSARAPLDALSEGDAGSVSPRTASRAATPLTAEALAQMQAEEDRRTTTVTTGDSNG